MRTTIILAILLLCIGMSCAQAQSQGPTLTGIVTDSATGKPLPGVSVYLNNTSHGVVTNSDGAFRLVVPPGTYQLIFSAIGYSTSVTELSSSHLPTAINRKLHPQATELTAITVEPYEKHGWTKYGKFFWENFIGIGPNAPSCAIRNKDALRFFFYKRSNRLRVTSAEPLIIENNALGYTLEYKLEEFVSDFNTHIISYYGYPFFMEKPSKNDHQRQQYIHNRRITYKGSMMHFMRSLYAGHSIRESFLMQRTVTVPNEEKHRVKELYHPDFQKPGLFPMDTLYYFWKVLREPEWLTKRIAVSPDTLLFTREDQSRAFYFDGDMTISYGVTTLIDSFRQSGIRLMSTQPITVEANGNYYPSREILSTGFWGQSEKISNLLPLDYDPDL